MYPSPTVNAHPPSAVGWAEHGPAIDEPGPAADGPGWTPHAATTRTSAARPAIARTRERASIESSIGLAGTDECSFDEHDEPVQDHAQQGDGQQGREEQRSIEQAAAREVDQQAQAPIGA